MFQQLLLTQTHISLTQNPILGPSTQWRAQQCKKVLLIFVNGTQSCCCWEGVAVFLELDLCPRHQLSPVGGLFLIPIFCFHFQMCFHFPIYSHFRAQFSIFFQQWHHWSWRKMDFVDNSCLIKVRPIQFVLFSLWNKGMSGMPGAVFSDTYCIGQKVEVALYLIYISDNPNTGPHKYAYWLQSISDNPKKEPLDVELFYKL